MRNQDEKGFTLVELMVAVTIGLILMAGVYTLYRNTQETYISQEKLVEAQQNTRLLLDIISREFRLAGYISTCTPAYASKTDFQFEADTDFDGVAERIYYKYIDDSLDSDYQTLFRATDGNPGTCAQMDAPEFVAVATDIEEVNFDFYDTNNGFIDPGGGTLDATEREEIRRITIRVKDEIVDPVTNKTRIVSMISDIRLRNEGIADSGGCAIPGAVSGFSVTDIKVCGRVGATWTTNPSSDDVTSYRLYSMLNGSANWTAIDDMGTGTSYTKLNDLVDGSTYQFAIAAKSACGVGPISAAVTVGPLNDNIGPEPATGLTTGVTTNSLDVDLNWGASTTLNGSGNPVMPNDVQGYNVFRSEDGGASWFGPVNTGLITGLNYTDTVDTACTMYDYRIQAVDACGNIGNFSTSASALPDDTLAPAEPTAFTAVSGGKYGGPNNYRITLSWDLPSDPDTEGVRVLFNKQNKVCADGDYPTNPNGNTLHADVPGSPGGSFGFDYDVFSNNKYYCFTAFAYDACPNYSIGSAATAQAKTCGDDPAGAPNALDPGSLTIENNPFKAEGPTLGVEDAPGEHRGRTGIIWTTGQNITNTPDLTGFNVYRAPSANDWGKTVSYNSKTFYGLTEAPVFFPSETDTDFNDNAGDTTDTRNTCVKFGPDGTSDTTVSNDDLADMTGINAGPDKICDSTANDNPVDTADDIQEAAPGNPQNPYLTRKLIPGETYEYVVAIVDCSEQLSPIGESIIVMPGRLDRDLRVNVTTSGAKKRNNIVNFGLRNTSASAMTIRSGADADLATISWTDPDARLVEVKVGGVTLWEDTSGTPTTTSGTPISFTTSLKLCPENVSCVGGITTPASMKLYFKDPTGSTRIDMRGNTFSVEFTHRNEQAYLVRIDEAHTTITADFSLTATTGVALSDVEQDPPQDVDSFPVPAVSSVSAVVPPGWTVDGVSDVVVTAVAKAASGSDIIQVYLRYFPDDSFLSTAPDPSVFSYASIAMGCFLDAETAPNCSADKFKAKIPADSGNRIWYFVDALDNKGRWSTAPDQTENDFIAYTYDQIGDLVIDPLTIDWLCAVPNQVLANGLVMDTLSNLVEGVQLEIEYTQVGTTGNFSSGTATTDTFGAFTDSSDQIFQWDTQTDVLAKKLGYNDKSCTVVLPWLPCAPVSVTCN